MTEGGKSLGEAMLVPAGVSPWAKEVGSLIVVDAVDFFATGGKEGNHFGSDEAGGAGYEELHACYLCGRWGRGGKERVFGPTTYLTPRSRSPDRVGVETQRANANLEEVQMYESANVVVGPVVSVGR